MIKKYVFGNPMETGAVVETIAATQGKLQYCNFIQERNRFFYKMAATDLIFGLGEQVRGINKRGWIYKSNCSDDPNHTESKSSLYAAHNFIIVDGAECFGIFIDTPGQLTFDIGYSSLSDLTIELEELNCYFYEISGADPEQIVREFRGLIGRSYIPPKWAFGYGQSRWSYETADEVRAVVRKHRELHIPLDCLYLDIDYMERYKDFTVDQQAFPDFKDFVKEMREQGIHLIPIIDAGVKIELGYEVYEEGTKAGYFCKKEDGENFIGAVWPGRVHFPDLLNDEARAWFGNKYKVLLDAGIDGFWNDMNEPAIFYSEESLQEVFQQIEAYRLKNMDAISFFEFTGLINGLANSPKDYQSFYHEYNGARVRHDKVHNLYGYYMTRAAGEAFERLLPEKRILMFSRASYIGMHRYGGVWTGDNHSWWSHLLLNIKMMPSLNMCGFLYSGADIGGFNEHVTQDLMLRWLQAGIFMPLLRNHSARGTRRQEVFQFEQIDIFRNIIQLRYGLLPYIYSEYMKAALQNTMYIKPLSFVYREDHRAKHVEDQLLVGESIMIAPVYEQNALGRYVYLPEDMKMLRIRSISQIKEEILHQGDHFVETALEEIVIFIRPGHILPLAPEAEHVEQVSADRLSCYSYRAEAAEYLLYDDDGCTKTYEEQLKVIKC